MTHDCGAILLAGGQSSRMGTPKPWLEFQGRPLLQLLVERLQTTFPRVLVVAAPGQELPLSPALRRDDAWPGQGPLAGLAVGLREVGLPLAFVVTCDVPFLNPELGAHLAELADDAEAVVPEWRGRLQPLQAIYRTTACPVVERQLAAGRLRAMELLSLLNTRTVPEPELRAWDPEGRTFFNVNRPEDYQQALAWWNAPEVRI